MKPAPMLCVHNPEANEYGDCLRACIASLLELPSHEVPHFAEGAVDGDGYSPELQQRLIEYLHPLGLDLVYVSVHFADVDSWRELMNVMGLDVHHIMTGRTSGGIRHAVVAHNGRVVYDPAKPFADPNDLSLQPEADGAYAFGLLVWSRR
jgi:hypothetical protein